MSATADFHMGRSWRGHEIEDECICPQARCGLVADPDPECPQHGAEKTMRQFHDARYCPARPLLVRWWVKLADEVANRRERRAMRRIARWRFDWRHPRASFGMAFGFGPHADGQAQWEIVSRLRWALSHYLCIGQWFWDGKDNCTRCNSLPSDVDFLMRRDGFRRAVCIDTAECKGFQEEEATK